MKTQSKKLLKLYLENDPICITTPSYKTLHEARCSWTLGNKYVDLVKTPEARFSKVLVT